MKTLKSILFFLVLLVPVTLNAQVNYDFIDDEESQSCTSIMVGRKASSDGSVMTSHTCDANYRTFITIEPRKHFEPGETEPIYLGLLHIEEPWDKRNLEVRGEIVPPKSDTYRYLNTAYPCLNEKQLAIGETTFDGRRELLNTAGLFYIEELERMALQYCDNARDAIKLMGHLAETYGYGDWGECLTVADKNEVWHFEIQGSGPGKPSAIWAAQRIPDDHVGVSANISRIGAIDFKDSDNFMYSSDLKERAKKLGYWDGKGPLVFHKVVGGVKPFSVREYYILNKLAPSLNLSMDMDELPFSVKPEMPVTPELMLELFRSTYEGTDLDMTKNLSIDVHRKIKTGGVYPNATYDEYDETVYPVNVFMTADMRQLLNKLKPGVTKRIRTVAVIQCSYAHVIQLRNWLPDAVGGVAYMALDNPAQSPRFPIYCGTERLPDAFNVCGQAHYREDAAIWAFRETNRIATIDWGKSRKILEPERAVLEKQMLQFGKTVEAEAEQLIKDGKDEEAAKVLTDYSCNFATMIMGRWKELKGKMLEIFIRSM